MKVLTGGRFEKAGKVWLLKKKAMNKNGEEKREKKTGRIKLEALENTKNIKEEKEWCINGACYGGIDTRVKRSR